MNLTDLAPDDSGPTIEAMHVFSVLTGPDRFFGHFGYHRFAALRAPGFTATIAVGDVVQITQTELGYYEVTAKLGTRANPSTEWETYGLPWGYGQDGWDVPPTVTFYNGVKVAPPAVLDARDGELVYGRSGGADRTVTAYYGHAGLWAYPSVGSGPARKLSILLAEPSPLPLKLTLLSARYPTDAHTPVDVTITPALDYYGPDVPNVIDLPANWKTAFAAGTAGSIRFGPAGATVGLTRLVAGDHRSLSLHT